MLRWAILLTIFYAAIGLRAEEPAWSKQEQNILHLVATGNTVDLGRNPQNVRTISFKLFRQLLTLPKEQFTSVGVRIENAIVDSEEDGSAELALINLDVPYEVKFQHCEFRGKLDLSGCRFTKGLSFANSAFNNGVRFERLQVDGHLDLHEAAFKASVEAPYAQISGNLLGGGTTFEGKAEFKEITVGHSIHFSALVDKDTLLTNQTVFKKGFDCSGSLVSHDFQAWKVQFDGDTKCDGLKVGGTIWMQECRFSGKKTSFGYASIGNDFDASCCEFGQTLEKANFYGLRCGSLRMDAAVFHTPVDFGNTAIVNDLSLCKTRFASQKPASFYAAVVKGSAYFDDSQFSGPANFILARVEGNFYALGTRFLHSTDLNSEPNPQSIFNADFGSLTVNGFTFFNDASFAGDVSFRNATIQNLIFDRVQWVGNDRSLRLEGLSYRRIRSVTNNVFELNQKGLEESWLKLKQTLRGTPGVHTPYSHDIYENLETYFRREGQPELADDVYIEGKRRERGQADLTSKIWNYFLDWTVGHGRKPGRAFLIALVPLLLGAWLFRQDNMQPTDSRKKPEELPFNSLWFSLDLFLPVLGLWIKDDWEPKKDKKGVWTYACLHKFIGWVLVPVGLAAFAGIVK